jgi:hypothetical protein
VRVVVTATNATYAGGTEASAPSAVSTVVQASSPVVVSAPVVSGAAQ